MRVPAALTLLTWTAVAPMAGAQVPSPSPGTTTLSILLESSPWRTVGIEDLRRLPQASFVDPTGQQRSGPLLAELLKSLGVTTAARARVEGSESAMDLAWPRIADPKEQWTLALRPNEPPMLVSRTGGPPSERPRWIHGIRSIDLLGARLGSGPASPEPDVAPGETPLGGRGTGQGTGPGRQGPGLAGQGPAAAASADRPPAEIAIVAPDGTARPFSVERIRNAARLKTQRDGQEFAFTPLLDVLAAAGFTGPAGVRVIGDMESLELRAGSPDAPDPKDYGVIFNRRGYPVLTRLDTAPGRAPDAGRPPEVRRLYRIEILRSTQGVP
jgi:hypothetical protein